MKRLFLFLTFSCLSLLSVNAQLVELAKESFENAADDHGYTILPENECACCSGSNFAWFRASGSPSCISFSTISGMSGSFYWAAERVSHANVQNPPSALSPNAAVILKKVAIKGSSDLEIRLLAGQGAPNHFDNGDWLQVQYAIDDGAYQTAAQFINNRGDDSNLAYDANVDGVVDGDSLTNVFKEFVADLGGATGDSLSVRLLFSSNSFSEEALVDHIRVYGTAIPLPLDLLDFFVRKTDKLVELKWYTANEVNTLGFEVERSGDGVAWEKQGWMPAKNNQLNHGYKYLDDAPLEGDNYYRLKMLDQDGAFVYSPVQSIEVQNRAIRLGTLYPNPVQEQSVFLPITALHQQEVTIQLFDQVGRQINSRKYLVRKGEQELELKTNDWPKGTLSLTIQTTEGPHSVRISNFDEY